MLTMQEIQIIRMVSEWKDKFYAPQINDENITFPKMRQLWYTCIIKIV